MVKQVVRRAAVRAGLAAAAALLAAQTATAQKSDLAVSPFVTVLPTAGVSPFAGLAMTFIGSSDLAFRGGAGMALKNGNTNSVTAGSYRPWAADADALLFLSGATGHNRGLVPWVFAGVGRGTDDSGAFETTHDNWSYGAGLSFQVGRAVDLFGESRWRMSRFVLPSAAGAPAPRNELRVGVTFHVASDDGRPGRRRW